MTANPGLAQQSSARLLFRVAGIVITVVGLGLLVWGVGGFVSGMAGDDMPDDGSMMWSMGRFALGGLMTVVGFGLLNAGFGGVAARYAAGETMPVVKDSLAHLTDGEGLGNLGRSADSPSAAETAGPFCSKCGVRNDTDATFCDACGNRIP